MGVRRNYAKGIHLSEFDPGDTIYLKKTFWRDHPVLLLCEFISYERGLVTGKILGVPESYLRSHIGEVIRVRKTNACLYGWDGESYLGGGNSGVDPYPHLYYHWFGKDGYVDGKR